MSGLSVAFTGRVGTFPIDVAFDAPSGVTALFGPSGSGKTSVLRAIAGLERLSGRCALDGEVWQDAATWRPTHRRALGYVFQEPSLFPHLSVRRNLGFGMAAPDAGAFERIVDLLKIAPLLDRAPAKLSGGERQRVSLGRALLSRPRLLLLDEPMSALDRQAKAEIMPYFESLHRALSIPIILVSHDIAEVERLADRVVLLDGGKVVANGPLNTVLLGADAGLWRDRDAASVLDASVTGYDAADGLTTLTIAGQTLLVAGRAGADGQSVRVRIAGRDVSLATDRPSQTTILNCLAVEIASIAALDGADVVVTLRLGDQALLARVTRRSMRLLDLKEGQPVFAQVKGVSLVAG